MSWRIFKYTVPIDDKTFVVEMPAPGQIVHVASQTGDTRDGVQVWAAIGGNPRLTVTYTFLVVGTGHPWPDDYVYVGTAHCAPFVWHLLRSVR